MVFVLKSAVSYLFIYKASIVRADQKAYLINRVEVYINVAKVILQFISVITIHSYLAYILLDVLAIAVQNITVSKIANKIYPFINNSEELSPLEKKNIFSDTSSVFLYKIAWSLLNGTDNILMSMLIGTICVGYYSNYCTITSNLETFIMLLFTSLTAGVGNLIATTTPQRRYDTFRSMQMVGNWLGAFVTVCLLFLTQDFIVLWIGKDMLLDGFALIAIVINMYYTICMRPVWTFREGTGMYRQIRYIMFATAILNLVLSVLMGRKWGVGGILIATSISKFLTCFWYEPMLLYKKFFGMKPTRYYLDYLLNVLITVVCSAICYFPIKMIGFVSISGWICKALICTVIVNVVYSIRYFRTPEFYNLRIKIYTLIKNKK